MTISETAINGLLIITPDVYKDDRGCFFEPYHKNKFQAAGIIEEFFQDNQSISCKDVIRGLHFQIPHYAQSKLVRVISGSVLDVVVDIRKNSNMYGKYFSILLSEKNMQMLYIPVGFAHGFLTLENNTVFSYKCSQVYNQESERSLLWNDPDIAINWNIENPILSKKDKEASRFKDLITPF